MNNELPKSLKSFLSFFGYSLLWLAFIGWLYQSWQAPPPQNISKEHIFLAALSFPSLEIDAMHGTAKKAQLDYRSPIKVTWPREMKSDSSDSITVEIDDVGRSAWYRVTKREGLETKSGILDFSDLRVREPLPENYELYVTAKLAANNFNLTLNSEEWQPLNGEMLSWVWNISPKQAGSQIVNLSIQAEIRDKRTGQKQTGRPLWSDELAINVNKPWFSKDQISIASIISCILGAGLTIPWIYERIQERRKKKKSKNRRVVEAKK